MKTLVRSIDKQQRHINQDSKENALSIQDLTRTVDYNYRRFEKFEQEQLNKNQQFEYNESLRKHQQELDDRERQRENQEYQRRQQLEKQNQERKRKLQEKRERERMERERQENERLENQRLENERKQNKLVENSVDSPVLPPVAEHEVSVSSENEGNLTDSPPVPVVNPESLT